MAKRTIAEARRFIDDNAASVNPPVWRALDAEVKEAVNAATVSATSYLDAQYTDALGVAQTTGQALCEVRDAARALTADLAAGRIPARDGAARWNQLRAQARRLAAEVDGLNETAERFAVIEEDPAGWFDQNFNVRFPLIRPDFSF